MSVDTPNPGACARDLYSVRPRLRIVPADFLRTDDLHTASLTIPPRLLSRKTSGHRSLLAKFAQIVLGRAERCRAPGTRGSRDTDSADGALCPRGVIV